MTWKHFPLCCDDIHGFCPVWGQRWISLEGPVMRSCEVFFILVWTSSWTNSRIADDSRRAKAHVKSLSCDVAGHCRFILLSPDLGAVSTQRCRLTSIGIPMIKKKRSHDRLFVNMGIPPYLAKTVSILRWGPAREHRLEQNVGVSGELLQHWLPGDRYHLLQNHYVMWFMLLQHSHECIHHKE